MQKCKHESMTARSISDRIAPFVRCRKDGTDGRNGLNNGKSRGKKHRRGRGPLLLPVWIGLCMMALLIPGTSAWAGSSAVWSELRLDKQAEVGHLAHYEGKVAGISPAQPAEIELIARNVEHGQTVFQGRVQTKDGHFRFGVQFYDGAPHQVLLFAYRPGETKPFAKQQVKVDVKTLHPPRLAQAKSFALLLGVTAVGMMVGAGLAWRQQKRKQIVAGS
jgi:hypothetical protein